MIFKDQAGRIKEQKLINATTAKQNQTKLNAHWDPWDLEALGTK